MFDFIKTILLVALFYALILFSFQWFNKERGGLTSVPYVDSFFNVLEKMPNWLETKSSKTKEILPINLGEWDDFLNK